MRHFSILLFILHISSFTPCLAQTTALPKPNLNRETLSVMQSFQQRHSTREYADKAMSKQDLSDLLWAAQGVNRDNGNLTAPTAMNRQEVRLYVFSDKSVSLYNPKAHSLTKVADGDHRDIVADRQTSVKSAPVILLLVADADKFGGNDEHGRLMMSVDVGIVCQNINLFCSAAGMKTVPRGTMNQQAIKNLLKLGDNQLVLINNPVGW